MDAPQPQAQLQPGALHWRLSSHPITLLTFLSFRIGMLRDGGRGQNGHRNGGAVQTDVVY